MKQKVELDNAEREREREGEGEREKHNHSGIPLEFMPTRAYSNQERQREKDDT